MSDQTALKKKSKTMNSPLVRLLSKPEITVGITLIVLCIILSIVRPNTFPTVKNFFNILRQFSLYAILGIGMGLVIITGGIDLSIGSVVAMSACLGTWVFKITKAPPIVILFVILGIGVASGILNGVLVAKAGIPPFIVTLGTLSVARGVALLITNGSPISYPATWISVFGGSYIGAVPVSVLVMALVVLIGYIFTRSTLTGRNIYAVGNSVKAAKLSGIPVDRIIILVYAITGFFAGLCGLLLVGMMNSADPSYGTGYEMDAIAAAVIGGISMSGGEGNVLGVVVGAALMGVLKNMFVLMAVSGYWQTIIIGSVIIGAVAIDSIRKKRASR